MAQAVWRGQILADSEFVEQVDGKVYFPASSVDTDFLSDSETETFCPEKGTAHFFHVRVGGEVNVDAAWYYPEPNSVAVNIKGYVAFWRGIEVSK